MTSEYVGLQSVHTQLDGSSQLYKSLNETTIQSELLFT